MKNKPILLVLLILICCNSDKISEKSIDLNNNAVNSLRSEKYSEALKYSEEAILADDSNIYFSLLLIGYNKSQSKMKELENMWKITDKLISQ